MGWTGSAAELAAGITHPGSGWRAAIAATPRHLFVPRWWEDGPQGWELRDGPSDEKAWMHAAYRDQTLVTSVDGLHADHAGAGDRPCGPPTSSSTLPSLVLRMYRHALLYPGAGILDVGTGSGYGCALLATRFRAATITSIDVDPYLTSTATERLAGIGLQPHVITCDATGPLPGEYDRIASMVSVKPVPASWLAALRPGGRLVTVLAGTTLIITATKGEDGWAHGRIEWDRAAFMAARTSARYPPSLLDQMAGRMRDDDAGHSQGRYPVLNVAEAWELSSMLEVSAPGIEHFYREEGDGTRTAWMLHPDGSWARASARGTGPPAVAQAGPQRLWDILDELRGYWLAHGQFPLHGAQVLIPPDGSKIHLARGQWETTIT